MLYSAPVEPPRNITSLASTMTTLYGAVPAGMVEPFERPLTPTVALSGVTASETCNFLDGVDVHIPTFCPKIMPVSNIGGSNRNKPFFIHFVFIGIKYNPTRCIVQK